MKWCHHLLFIGKLARHAKILLKSNFGVTFSSLLQDVETSRKLDPVVATKMDNLTSTKRDKIHLWLLRNLNQAIKLANLKPYQSIPWVALSKGILQEHHISMLGWPEDIEIQKRLPKVACDTLWTLIQASEISISVHRSTTKTRNMGTNQNDK